jgi:phosphoribosylglycinamide formyltransferase 2
MSKIGTPFSSDATKVLLCGAGELGKEVAIELQRLGCEVIAVDRYSNAPAMQVAHRSHVIDMLDKAALLKVIRDENPDVVLPEIEAIATDALIELESDGFKIAPTALAAKLTMNREGIRRLAAEELGLPTSPYQFAENFSELQSAVTAIGLPCVIKPIMSSSGKGQSVIRSFDELEKAWEYSQSSGRAGQGKVIIEGFIPFDYEITMLTVRHMCGDNVKTSFCQPIGHVQVDGDYVESWQPHPMNQDVIDKAQEIAGKVTSALGGTGLFGVELFVKGDSVIFSEVSPRPHDTGLVTLISQDLSEFALHARAVLGLPIPDINHLGPSASATLLVDGKSSNLTYGNLDGALSIAGTQLRLFGKPEVNGKRRMGVGLATGKDINEARSKALSVIEAINIKL